MKALVVVTCCALLLGSATLLRAEERKPATAPAPKAPAVTAGTWTGTVTEKGDNWIRVKNTEGKSERFTPQWVNGGLDKTILQKIHDTRVGSKVSLKWAWNERMRVLDLTLIEAPSESKTSK